MVGIQHLKGMARFRDLMATPKDESAPKIAAPSTPLPERQPAKKNAKWKRIAAGCIATGLIIIGLLVMARFALPVAQNVFSMTQNWMTPALRDAAAMAAINGGFFLAIGLGLAYGGYKWLLNLRPKKYIPPSITAPGTPATPPGK
nr:hypothetical protein [Candidatus Sigynarchaeota archaeon]